MPIIKRVPLECKCPNKPYTEDLGLGSIWECDRPDCRKHWELSWDIREQAKYWQNLFFKTY